MLPLEAVCARALISPPANGKGERMAGSRGVIHTCTKGSVPSTSYYHYFDRVIVLSFLQYVPQ